MNGFHLKQDSLHNRIRHTDHLCPVSLDKVDPKSFIEYTNEEDNIGGRIYLCCDACGERPRRPVPLSHGQKDWQRKEAWDVLKTWRKETRS